MIEQHTVQFLIDALLDKPSEPSATEADLRRVMNSDQLPAELRTAVCVAVAGTPYSIGDDLRLTAGEQAAR